MTDPTASTRSGGAAADAQLLNSSKYSDLTITCGADTHLLHRAIVCPRSVSFDAACEEGSRVSNPAVLVFNDLALTLPTNARAHLRLRLTLRGTTLRP